MRVIEKLTVSNLFKKLQFSQNESNQNVAVSLMPLSLTFSDCRVVPLDAIFVSGPPTYILYVFLSPHTHAT